MFTSVTNQKRMVLEKKKSMTLQSVIHRIEESQFVNDVHIREYLLKDKRKIVVIILKLVPHLHNLSSINRAFMLNYEKDGSCTHIIPSTFIREKTFNYLRTTEGFAKLAIVYGNMRDMVLTEDDSIKITFSSHVLGRVLNELGHEFA